MASNIVRNRDWIHQTYVATPQAYALQRWVDAHPAAVTQAEIAEGLALVMEPWGDGAKANLSKHFSGQAFDVQPGSCPIEALETVGATKILTHEGGLVRWHLQF